jgi:hypothetical protein
MPSGCKTVLLSLIFLKVEKDWFRSDTSRSWHWKCWRLNQIFALVRRVVENVILQCQILFYELLNSQQSFSIRFLCAPPELHIQSIEMCLIQLLLQSSERIRVFKFVTSFVCRLDHDRQTLVVSDHTVWVRIQFRLWVYVHLIYYCNYPAVQENTQLRMFFHRLTISQADFR